MFNSLNVRGERQALCCIRAHSRIHSPSFKLLSDSSERGGLLRSGGGILQSGAECLERGGVLKSRGGVLYSKAAVLGAARRHFFKDGRSLRRASEIRFEFLYLRCICFLRHRQFLAEVSSTVYLINFLPRFLSNQPFSSIITRAPFNLVQRPQNPSMCAETFSLIHAVDLEQASITLQYRSITSTRK